MYLAENNLYLFKNFAFQMNFGTLIYSLWI